MAINKIVLNSENGEQVLVDLTGDSVTPETTFAGSKGHGADGEPFTGTFTIRPELDEQYALIEQIEAELIGKAAGGGAVSENWTFTLTDGSVVAKTDLWGSVQKFFVKEGEVATASCNGEVLWQSTLLPDGYREVMYLESTKTQYIDTGVVPSTTTDFEIIGSITDNTQTAWIVGAPTWVGVHVKAGTVAVTQTSSGMTYNSVAVNEVFKLGLFGDEAYFNDLKTNTIKRQNGTMTLFLFAYHHANDIGSIQSKSRIYSFKIWDTGLLVRNFIPALDTNGVPCMYDTVSETTFYNQGTGEFNYGY